MHIACDSVAFLLDDDVVLRAGLLELGEFTRVPRFDRSPSGEGQSAECPGQAECGPQSEQGDRELLDAAPGLASCGDERINTPPREIGGCDRATEDGGGQSEAS